MEHLESNEQDESNYNFTLFGEPIIKTRCQRDAFMYGISGGIISGLVGFLFTSSGRSATRIGVLSYIAITGTLACKCTYEELKMRKEARVLKKLIYEMSQQKDTKDMKSDDSPGKLESI